MLFNVTFNFIKECVLVAKKLYVGNLPYSVVESDLEGLFSAFGKINEVLIPKDRDTGNVKGFAFVTLDDDVEAEKAAQDLNGQDVGGRKIIVNEAREKGSAPVAKGDYKKKKLYVNNLPFKMTEAELTDLFSPFGAVEVAKIIQDRDTGRSRGFAFVTMGNSSEAAAALSGLDGKDVGGRAVMVKEAENKPNAR